MEYVLHEFGAIIAAVGLATLVLFVIWAFLHLKAQRKRENGSARRCDVCGKRMHIVRSDAGLRYLCRSCGRVNWV